MPNGRWFPIWDKESLELARANAANRGMPLWHVYDKLDDMRLVAYYVGVELPAYMKAKNRYVVRRKG